MTARAVLACLLVSGVCAFGGPPYPVTAAWFRDRFTYGDWNKTLAEFQTQGGDTVFLRAPPIIERTRDDLLRDPMYVWCGSVNSSTGVDGIRCFDEAVQEVTQKGLKVRALLTYEYEEGFSDAIMLCPQLDRKINSSRLYYRLVLPIEVSNDTLESCDFPEGANVAVLFTSFAGTDPHALLLDVAASRNITVFFGLPAAPQTSAYRGRQGALRASTVTFDDDLMGAYYGWVYRVLREHQIRYGSSPVTRTSSEAERSFPGGNGFGRFQKESLYDWLGGYYVTDECCLAQVDAQSPYVRLYQTLGRFVHALPSNKKLALSPYIDLNRSQLNATVLQHVQGMEAVAATGEVDVVAVQEGRGAGKGCYYWATQRNVSISRVDPVLDRVLRYLDPSLKLNVTFSEACTASNQEVFGALERSRESLNQQGVKFDLWLNVEAFEYLRDDPCLPVDISASGMGELLNRASKSRIDHALTVASARVQKVISFAWDSDYTCTTKQYKSSLAAEIRANFGQPIIANCSFHSPANKSIVVIGYNLLGIQQAYQVNWPARGQRRISSLYGYYFETDWGMQNDRVPSLIYTQLYDLPGVLEDLDYKGWVSVGASNVEHECVFEYDFTSQSHAQRRTYNSHRRPASRRKQNGQ